MFIILETLLFFLGGGPGVDFIIDVFSSCLCVSELATSP